MTAMPHLRKRVIGTLFFFALSVALVIILVGQITVLDVKRLASRLTVSQFVLLSGLYLLMAYFRGIRLGYVIREGNHARLTAIAALHAFLNHILPFRLGELSLPFLVKAFTPRGLTSGSLSLIVVRLYDAVSIALLSLLSLLVVGGEFSPSVREVLWISGVGVVLGFAVVFRYLGAVLAMASTAGCRLLSIAGRRGEAVAVRIRRVTDHMHDEIDALGAMQKYVFLPASSVAVTVANYALFYFAMVFMGIDIGFFKNMLASLGELVTTFLPNTLGSFGTMEAGWAAGYALCGVQKADAIATGFIMHGIIILSGFVFSVCGMLYLLAGRRLKYEAGS
jgi:uncharacterized membrane protein YbhN (UPF0104 family)